MHERVVLHVFISANVLSVGQKISSELVNKERFELQVLVETVKPARAAAEFGTDDTEEELNSHTCVGPGRR